MDKKKQLIVAVLGTALVFGGGGFAFGKKSLTPQVPQGLERGAFGNRAPGQNGMARTMGTGRTGGMTGTAGEVLSKDAQSMTIALRDGGSRIVFYGTSTPVMHTATGTIGDIDVGTQVFVSGAQNPDGSMTAESIQLRPEAMGSGMLLR
jgi:hypothetical protein